MEDSKATRYRRSKNLHVRTVGFPPDLYERIVAIAKREDRDVTAQIIRMLRESLDRHEEKPPGQTEAAILFA
jgi:hypothetical protein